MKRNTLVWVLAILMFGVFWGFGQGQIFKSIETQELIIRGSQGTSYIKMEANKKFPTFSLVNSSGKEVAFLTLEDEETPVLILKDEKETSRILVKGGETPGIFLRNGQNRTIGSWSILKDGGAGFGLAYESGIASTILRGGNNPSIAFFSGSLSPSATFGISKDIPHMLVSGSDNKEAILLHGGESPGMMVLDDLGQLRIHISKLGILEGQEQKAEKPAQKEKLFTYEEDYQLLFPDQKEKVETR